MHIIGTLLTCSNKTLGQFPQKQFQKTGDVVHVIPLLQLTRLKNAGVNIRIDEVTKFTVRNAAEKMRSFPQNFFQHAYLLGGTNPKAGSHLPPTYQQRNRRQLEAT